MSAEDTELACPICLTTTNSKGGRFSSPMSVGLHIAGKAKTTYDPHRSWVRKLVPSIDLRTATLPQIHDQIEFYVGEALDELKEKVTLADSFRDELKELEELLQQTSFAVPVDSPGGRSDEDLDQYMTAYKLIWITETRLHRFIATVLDDPTDGQLFKAFSTGLQTSCFEEWQKDNHKSPIESYVYLLSFGDIIKHNNDLFSEAFDRLNGKYKDPRSVFYPKLKEMNGVRNHVMHPVRRLTPSNDDLIMLEEFAEFVRAFVNEV